MYVAQKRLTEAHPSGTPIVHERGAVLERFLTWPTKARRALLSCEIVAFVPPPKAEAPEPTALVEAVDAAPAADAVGCSACPDRTFATLAAFRRHNTRVHDGLGEAVGG